MLAKPMIKILRKDGKFTHVVICDICHEMITNASRAAVVSRLPPEGEAAEALHVHKGRCHDQAEARIGVANCKQDRSKLQTSNF